jgi:microcompartment protein CcmL/EutN
VGNTLTGAARLRRFRERRASGRAVWMVEGDVDAVERMLEAAELLPVCTDHSHSDVQAALNRFHADVQAALNKLRSWTSDD